MGANICNQLLKWRPGSYLRASSGLFVWLLVRVTAQAAMVLLLAHLLGPEGYGMFVAILAVAGFFVPLAGMGLGVLLLRDGAREPESIQQRLGMALALWWPAALILTVIAVPAIAWALPSSVSIFALIVFAFSEIVTTSLIELSARVEQSQHRARAFGGLITGLVLARLIGLLVYTMLLQPDPIGWIWVYAVSSIVYTAAAMRWFIIRYRPVWPSRRDWSLVKDGLPFTIGALSLRLQSEFNKPLLTQVNYGYAGIFGIAQRIVELASLPLHAMQEVLWPRFYAGSHPRRRIWTIAGSLVALALLGGALLVLLSPWLPHLLGAGFEETAEIVVLLALLPAMQTIRNLLNIPIIASGKQAFLTWVYIFGGIASVTLASVLVPQYGLVGAVWALYLSESIALLLLLYGLFKFRS